MKKSIRKPRPKVSGTRASKRNISDIMRKVQSSGTSPEILFGKALKAKGVRYRGHVKKLPGKPDFILSERRLAIFIDGDFWHGGQWQKRKHVSLNAQLKGLSSKDYWLKKIKRNMQRDCEKTNELLRSGWSVLRFWESQINKDLDECMRITTDSLISDMKPDAFSVLAAKIVAEFFSGIGLMRMGLERHGWTLKFANDIDRQKCEMYGHQFPDAKFHLVCNDIHKLDIDSVPSVTLATASFPCNDLSLAGARAGLKGKQSSAFWGFIEILEKLGERRPPIVLLENVTGFLTSHAGNDFKSALIALNRLGYSVDAFIIDAAKFVPQSRQRLFIIGSLDDHRAATEVREQLQFFESDLRPKALADFILKHQEINWKIRKLPSLPKQSAMLEDIIESIPDQSKEWWSKERADYLLNQMSPRHKEIAKGMIKGSKYSYGTVFRRIRNGKSMAELRIDGIAGCLRTPRGGSGRQILFKAGKGRYFARLLTPRECARLMGADDFLIKVPLNQALFGFGDAVCVHVIEWIAEYYLNPLVNEMMRGRPLIAYGKETIIREKSA